MNNFCLMLTNECYRAQDIENGVFLPAVFSTSCSGISSFFQIFQKICYFFWENQLTNEMWKILNCWKPLPFLKLKHSVNSLTLPFLCLLLTTLLISSVCFTTYFFFLPVSSSYYLSLAATSFFCLLLPAFCVFLTATACYFSIVQINECYYLLLPASVYICLLLHFWTPVSVC